ncbi:hypothetical protein L7F22_054512 [Adiantum nelumboides]|nr:hypothetical protein [Adiantum nelumboides]
MATRSQQLDWQEIHLSEDEASAQGTHAVRFLVQQVEKAQNNSRLRPMLNNLMRAHGLQLLNYEPPTQDPSFQEASNEGNAREERGAHSQDDASSGRSRFPSRRIRRSLEREDNSLRYEVQESETKRKRSPSCEVSSSPSLRGRKREREHHARRRYKPKRTPSPSSSPSKRSSFSSSSSSDGYSSSGHHNRRRHDTYRTWKRSRRLQKFKEGGKIITFQTYDSSYEATDKLLSFIQQYCAGLTEDIRAYVNDQKPCTIAEVIHRSKVHGREQVSKDSKGNGSKGKKDKVPYKGPGKLYLEEMERYKKENRCYMCGETGHISRACPKRQQRKETPQATQILYPTKEAKEASQLCFAWGKVRDMNSLILFDPGSTHNFISIELAQRLRIQTEEMGTALEASVLFSVTGFGFDLANWFRISDLRQLNWTGYWLETAVTGFCLWLLLSGSGLLVSSFCLWLLLSGSGCSGLLVSSSVQALLTYHPTPCYESLALLSSCSKLHFSEVRKFGFGCHEEQCQVIYFHGIQTTMLVQLNFKNEREAKHAYPQSRALEKQRGGYDC